jgi:hypothetical protein
METPFIHCLRSLANPTTSTPNPCVIKPSKVDYAALHPYFGWLPTSVVEKTFKVMTQYARMPMSTILKKWYKCPFPALNIFHCDEPVATDMVYSDIPAIDSGASNLCPAFLWNPFLYHG